MARMWKKTLALMLAVMLLFSMAGCGEEEQSEEQQPVKEEQELPQEESETEQVQQEVPQFGQQIAEAREKMRILSVG